MRVLVIGSNSFSGSNFVNQCLQRGDDVYGVSRSREPDTIFLPYKWKGHKKGDFEFSQININTQLKELMEIIDDNQIEYVVNFAAQGMVAESWQNPVQWYETNVISQVAFHDELRHRTFVKKYIHITTPEVYGSTGERWVTEEQRFNPSTPYAVSRGSCDMHLRSYYKAYKFPVIFTRAANVYGPGQQLYRIIPRTILSIKKGVKLTLHGGGNSRRSFVHIEDVISATSKLMESAEIGTEWHISTKKIITIRRLVEKICEQMGANFDDVVEVGEERLGKDQEYLLASDKIREKMGWEEKITLDKGIGDTIKWVDRNFEKMDRFDMNYVHKH